MSQQDPEMEGLTLYEKKALLVNRELDSYGMGKYQWYIFFLCGFGYLIDLLFAQVFGLIEPALQQEFGFGKKQSGNLSSSFSAGLSGRQYAFNLTVLIAAVFGMCLAAPSDYNGVLVLAAFVGIGVGGNIPIDTTICLEFIPQESPKFLLYRGKDEKAVKVLHNIAKFNGRESSINRDIFEALDKEERYAAGRNTANPAVEDEVIAPKRTWKENVKLELLRYKTLFSTFNMARLTTLIWITYMFDYWGFSIAGYFLPQILIAKNSAINVSLRKSYLNFIIIYICGAPGVVLGALMYGVPRIGRQWAMVGSSALMGTSLFLFATVNTEASNIGLNAMEYFFQSMFNAVLYAWTPEAYPAPIRGTAAGVASFWGRLFSIISPLIAADLLAKSVNAPLFLAGAGVFVCTVCLILMPSKSLGAQSY
ncbi:hypothetical protein ACLMJK_004188 [Lecanora helva]